MAKRIGFSLLLLIAVSLGAFWLVGSRSADNSNAFDTWSTTRATKGTLAQSIIAIGTIKPEVGAEVKVGSQISGVVKKLHVNIGDLVAKGDVLAVLVDKDLRARVDSAAADLESARAELHYAETELHRFEVLGDSLAKSQLDSARTNVEVRRAAVGRSVAQLALAKRQLDYTNITAPLSGTIASVTTYEGETVAASFAAPTFVTIVDLSRLEIQCFVDETDIGSVRVGEKVAFRVDAFPADEKQGVVRAILPKAQLINSVVNYVVIVSVPSDQYGPLLRPEMTVHVGFELNSKDDVLSLPRSAVLREGKERFIVVRTPNGWVRRAVNVGLSTTQQVEITSGLSPGEAVLTDAQLWMSQRGRQEQ